MKQDQNKQQGGWGQGQGQGQGGKTQQKQPNLGNQQPGQGRPGTPSGFGGGKDQNRDQNRGGSHK